MEKVLGVPARGRRVCGLEPDNPQERVDFVRVKHPKWNRVPTGWVRN
jgi:hypothetical protein